MPPLLSRNTTAKARAPEAACPRDLYWLHHRRWLLRVLILMQCGGLMCCSVRLVHVTMPVTAAADDPVCA
ncbi:unnamed protein product [Urochloa humidicola]